VDQITDDKYLSMSLHILRSLLARRPDARR
jgi:hypothetical protein